MPPDAMSLGISTPEQVLCTPTSVLPSEWLPTAGAVAMSEVALLEGLSGMAPVWLPRSAAELDPGFKQWIPYGLVQAPCGRLACYRRRGSEERLKGVRSLGIGGHVNPVDAPAVDGLPFSWRQALWNGFRRELAEELPAAVPGTTRFLGLIHESRSEVGRVHIGMVFLHQTATPAPMDGGELGDLEWLRWPLEDGPLEDGALEGDAPELWSRLALSLLKNPCMPHP